MNSRLLILAGLLLAVTPAAFAQGDDDAAATETPTPADPAATETLTPADPAPVQKSPESAVSISLGSLAVCTSVEDRVPVGKAEEFSSDVGQLWCFTRILNADAPTQIFHRWYVGDSLVNEIPINVKSTQWRCWSAKTIRPSWKGTCRVEILTEEGDIIGTQEFNLSPTDDAASSSSDG